jgi:hypothetical protein
MRKLLILTLLLPLSVVAQKPKNNKVVPNLCGQVWWVAGNQMPRVGAEPSATNGKKPVQREVYIYELTTQKQTVSNDLGLYSNISTKLLRRVKTDAHGYFCVSLPAGNYSIFTKEPQGLFANNFDDVMNINPVIIEKGKKQDIQIVINYNAVY